MPTSCTARLSRTKQFNCHFLLKMLHRCWEHGATPHPDEFTWKGNREKTHCNKHNHKNNSVCVRGWGACRRTDRCQSELLSLSRVSALNNLTSTLVKQGAVFACLVLHDRILGKVSTEALRSACCWLSAIRGRSWLTMTYGKWISTSPYAPPSLLSLPPSSPSNRAG